MIALGSLRRDPSHQPAPVQSILDWRGAGSHNCTLILLSPSPSLSNAPSLKPSPSLAHVSLSPVSLTPAKDPVTGFGGIRRVRSQHDGGFAPAGFCSDDTDRLAPALSQQLLSTGDALSLHRSCLSHSLRRHLLNSSGSLSTAFVLHRRRSPTDELRRASDAEPTHTFGLHHLRNRNHRLRPSTTTPARTATGDAHPTLCFV